MKKILLLLTMIFLFSVSNVNSQGNIEVYFNGENVIHTTSPSYNIYPMEVALLNKINNARVIRGAIYSINRPWIVYALCNVENRRGMVELVVDKNNYYNSASYSYWFGILEECGVAIKPSTSNNLMHNKFLIFDRQSVWTGSTNLTNTGFTYNANNSIIFNDPNIAILFEEEWRQMYVEERFSTAKDPVYGVFNYPDGTQVAIYFTPTYDTETLLYRILREELDTSFHALVFYWTNQKIRDVFLEYKPETILIGWEANGFGNEYSASYELCRQDVSIRVEAFGGKIHDKFMVLNQIGGDPVVITGSCNFSNSCFFRNDETLIIIRNNDNIGRQYAWEAAYIYHSIPERLNCHEHSAEWGFPACSDGVDNDYDGYLDGDDWDCQNRY